MAAQMGATVSISAPDPRFQKGTDSILNMASRPEQSSPQLDVSYFVSLIIASFVGVALLVYFARARKATTHIRPDPIPAREPKERRKVVEIGLGVLAVGLAVLMALAGVNVFLALIPPHVTKPIFIPERRYKIDSFD